MKMPLIAVLGVAGACAACCTIPLLLPLLGGTAVAALLAGWGLELGTLLNLLIATAAVAAVAATLWVKHKRKAAPASCTLPPGGCSCGPKAAR